jgi:tetratricopeptide (TPR) repeat protein
VEIRVLGEPLFQNKTGDENTYYWLATAYNEWGWNEHALAINDAAIRKAPMDITSWSQRTEILVSLGRFKEALTANKRAIRLARSKTEKRRFFPEQARILFRLGRFREARAVVKKTLPFGGSWLRWLKDELNHLR